METALEKSQGYDKITSMSGMSSEELAIIHSAVAKGTTLSELAYFMQFSKALGLNPFLKETWCYKDNKGNLIVFAGKDGFLKKAQENPKFGGIVSSAVCANDACEIDVPNGLVTHKINPKDRGEVIGAYARVKVLGVEIDTLVWIDRRDYDKKWNVWQSNPAAMCEKVAVTQACKKAFGISGLQSEYDFEEVNGKAMPNKDYAKTVIAKYKKQIEDMLQECQDDELRTEIVTAILDAEEAKNDAPEFYESLISKLSGHGKD